MKKFCVWLLILSITVTLVASLSACGDGDNGSSSMQNGSESTPPEKAWYSDLDFGGEKLVISQSINVWAGCPTVDNAEKYTRGPEEIGSDTVLNLCYSRNKEAKTALNLQIEYTPVNYKFDEINPYIDTLAVMNGNKIPDLLINDEFALSSAQLKGQLYNVKDQSEENYFNFEHEAWYMDYMLGFTIDPEKIYGLGSDYFFDIVRTARALFINIELFEVMCGEHYETINDFYKMIENGDWTYTEFEDLIQAGWKSTSGQASAVLEDEIIGFLFTSQDGYMQVVPSSGVSMIEMGNEGRYIAKENISELSSYMQAVNSLLHTDGVVHANHNSEADFRKIFTENGALFLNGYYLGDLEFPSFFAMEEKSVIVYPKWNEAQERYYTTVHDSAEIGYIMKNTDSFTPTSAYLQLLSEESVNIMNEYFLSVQYKYNTDPEAIGMLNIIRDTIYRSPEMYVAAYSGANTLSLVAAAVKANNPPQATNTYQSNLPNYRSKIAELYEKFEALD